MGEWPVLRYGVRFASDDEMPEGHDVLVIHSPDEAIVFYRESVVDKEAVTTAWASLHALAAAGMPMPADELTLRRMTRDRLSKRSGSWPERQIGSSSGRLLRIWE